MNGLFDLNASEVASTSTSFEENSFERAYQTLGSVNGYHYFTMLVDISTHNSIKYIIVEFIIFNE